MKLSLVCFLFLVVSFVVTPEKALGQSTCNASRPRLTAREIRLANELEMERARLNELNERLNALELELVPK